MIDKLWAWARNLLTHPTIEAAFAQSVISYAISQGLFNLSVEQTGVVMAIVTSVTGLIAAALTQQALLVWLISLGQAVGALVVTFDLAQRFHWNTQTAAAWIAVLVFLLGLAQHSKASPKYGPLAKAREAADGSFRVTDLAALVTRPSASQSYTTAYRVVQSQQTFDENAIEHQLS